MVRTETLKTSGNVKKKASQKLSVSFLHDLNKHKVYRGIKLYSNHTEINVHLMEMSMLVLMLLPGCYSFQSYIFNDL